MVMVMVRVGGGVVVVVVVVVVPHASGRGRLNSRSELCERLAGWPARQNQMGAGANKHLEEERNLPRGKQSRDMAHSAATPSGGGGLFVAGEIAPHYSVLEQKVVCRALEVLYHGTLPRFR